MSEFQQATLTLRQIGVASQEPKPQVFEEIMLWSYFQSSLLLYISLVKSVGLHE